MYNKFVLITILLILMVLPFVSGCTSDNFYVEREGVVIDIGIGYILQDKQFKSLEYNTKTGVIKIEKFSSETSEVVSDLVDLITTLK